MSSYYASLNKSVMAGRVLGSLAIFPMLFTRPVCENFGLAGFFTLMPGIWLLVRFARRLTQSMENRADRMEYAVQPEAGL